MSNRKPIAHGTYAGACQHYRAGGSPVGCRLGCAEAYRAYKRPYRPKPGGLAAGRAAELEQLYAITRRPAQQAAWDAGVSVRTITRYRALLRVA